MFNAAHSGNSAELVSLERVDNKIEDSFNQQSKVCAVSSAGSEADVVHSEKAMSLSQELRPLMKSFLMAERRLSEIKQEMWALVKNSDTEEDIVKIIRIELALKLKKLINCIEVFFETC